jgi:Uma2 family endonuclease
MAKATEPKDRSRLMATAAITRAEAVDNSWHVVTLLDVDWETYCQLRDEPANERVRMEYLDGELTLMSPEAIHDEGAELLGLVLRGVTSGLGLAIKGIRTATLRRGTARRKGAGKEPDNAFYIGENERPMRNMKKKGKLDLAVDLPPDVAIEVDNTRNSKRALAIYARLGVPEVWRYDGPGHSLWFGRLAGDHYEPVDRSVALPRLTTALVLQALDVFDEGEMDENAWFEWLKGWARGLPEAPATA